MVVHDTNEEKKVLIYTNVWRELPIAIRNMPCDFSLMHAA